MYAAVTSTAQQGPVWGGGLSSSLTSVLETISFLSSPPYGLWGRPSLFKPWAAPSWLVVDPAFLAATFLPEPPRALTTKYLGPAFSLFSQLGLTCPFSAPLLLCPLISSSSVCRCASLIRPHLPGFPLPPHPRPQAHIQTHTLSQDNLPGSSHLCRQCGMLERECGFSSLAWVGILLSCFLLSV